jgi:hypothetical protein
MRYTPGSSVPIAVSVLLDGVEVRPSSVGLTLLRPDGTIALNNITMEPVDGGGPGDYEYIYASSPSDPAGVWRYYTTVVGTNGETITETTYGFELAIALIVEDGSGKINADSYVSVEDADVYASTRGNDDWCTSGGYTYGQKAAALRIATRYLDSTFTYIGYVLYTQPPQALKWPRLAAYDEDYKLYSGVPVLMIQATCELAASHLREGPINAVDYNPYPNIFSVGAGGVNVAFGSTRGGLLRARRAIYTYVKDSLSPLTTGGSGQQIVRS